MSTKIELHLEGEIARDHRVTLRTLGKALNHLQNAIDRAHLDTKHGKVWKHARLKEEDYPLTEFILSQPREGGYILDMVSDTADAIGNKIKKTIERAVDEAMNLGAEESVRLKKQAQDKYNYAYYNQDAIPDFSEFSEHADEEMERAYGERSVAKEIDQLLSIIRHSSGEDDKVSITIDVNGNIKTFAFDRPASNAFHKAVSRRDLGNPVIYTGVLRSLDKGNKYSASKGKFRNSHTKREITIHIGSNEHFDQLHPYLTGEQEISIVASPVVEYGSFDPNGGDIYFIAVLDSLNEQ